VPDQKQLQVISQGVSAWYRWRTENPDVIPNLSGANLNGANLGGAHLIGAGLIGAGLIGAGLIAANLGGAYLIGTNLVGCRAALKTRTARVDSERFSGFNCKVIVFKSQTVVLESQTN
jgi:hypothetical protein